MVYHILNGDCLAEQLNQTSIQGQQIVCTECLVEGDVSGDPLSEFWETRFHRIRHRILRVLETTRRDELEREFESFKIGLLLKKAREDKQMTQGQLADLLDKKRTYISRVENDGSNITLKTLYDIVEKGLGGKVKISIEF